MTLAQFRRDGFAVVRDLINVGILDTLVADIGGVFGRRARALGLDLPDPLDHQGMSTLLTGLFDQDRSAYMATARQTQHLASVHRLGFGPELMRIVADLGLAGAALFARAVIPTLAAQVKSPGGCHQNPHPPGSRRRHGSLL